jgi:hypothetical protein
MAYTYTHIHARMFDTQKLIKNDQRVHLFNGKIVWESNTFSAQRNDINIFH